ADMAAMAPKRIAYGDLVPGDIMFYDGDGDGVVDHVDTYIGNGYALDSSSTPGGVSIMWVGNSHGLYGSDWYRTHFKWGRRILPHLPVGIARSNVQHSSSVSAPGHSAPAS